ncbi:MAG: B12-binding domain-containing radical SAM protein [Deltaproteobacteria bacterium]|nr:B12-binding domain-containing radical SAM protein [Deltaproteobacteria bacterium]
MKKKIAIILPTQYDARRRPVYARRASANYNYTLPLLAALTPKDFDVEIIYERLEGVNFDAPYALAAITSITNTVSRAYDLADEFRKRGTPVALGGYHVSALPEEAAPHADAVVIGEAEPVWEALIDDVRHGTIQPVYRSDRFTRMEQLPVPRYDLMKQHLFYSEVYPVEATRGCPCRCEYCSVTGFYGAKFRHRPVEEVLEHIDATGSRFISFVDDNIISDRRYALELFRAMKSRNIRFVAQSTLDLADDDDLLTAACDAGLRFVWCGVESLSRPVLEEAGRRVNRDVETFERRVRRLRSRGIVVASFFMVGFDNDTAETYAEIEDFVMRNRIVPGMNLITPFPGTEFWNKAEAAGRIMHRDWWRYTGYETVYKPLNMTVEEQNTLYRTLLCRLFSPRANVRRFAAAAVGGIAEGKFLHPPGRVRLQYERLAHRARGRPRFLVTGRRRGDAFGPSLYF